MDLRLTEIFYSLQGEARTVGRPTVFVRLTGCPQRCVWCDTEYAFSGGEKWSLEAILDQVAGYQAHYVTVTGGEPLAQPNCLVLLTALCDQGYEVSLETGGAMDIAEVDPRVSVVMDLKAPGSGEQHNNRLENIPLLRRITRSSSCWRTARTMTGPDLCLISTSYTSGSATCCFLRYRGSWPRESWLTGLWRTACRCGFSCNCTNYSGMTPAGAS